MRSPKQRNGTQPERYSSICLGGSAVFRGCGWWALAPLSECDQCPPVLASPIRNRPEDLRRLVGALNLLEGANRVGSELPHCPARQQGTGLIHAPYPTRSPAPAPAPQCSGTEPPLTEARCGGSHAGRPSSLDRRWRRIGRGILRRRWIGRSILQRW